MRRRGRLRETLFVAVALLGLGLGLLTYSTETFKSLEFDSVDARFAIRGDDPEPVQLAVVGIDDQTFGRLKVRFPFSRTYHARVIDRLHEDGAKIIAYDIQFSEQTTLEADNALIEASARAKNVVFATTETDNGKSNALGGQDGLDAAKADSGNALFPGQRNGVYRTMPYEVEGLRGFAVVAAEKAGLRIDKSKFDRREAGADTAWMDYAGQPGTIKSVPFWRVLRGQFPKGTFKNRVVVVGPVAPSLGDVHPTSTSGDEFMSGAEIQANAIKTALDDFPLSDTPGWLEVLAIIVLALLAPLASLRLSPVRALVLAGATGIAYTGLAQLLFNGGHVIAFVYPMLGLLFATVGALAVHYLTAAFERERVRDMFARFVPESVVDEVLADADGLRLGGVRRECTVMFSDVRGFTTFAENTQPSEVISILNRYLTAMSEAILDHGGTLIAYMGDGIMAAFGAPTDQPDHADRALAAGREMLRRLDTFNAELQAEGKPVDFRMGIGLNTGSVMAGNVGSERRLEYTTIGDTVNTAARMEGMTKGTPHQLFISESCWQAMTKDPGDMVFVGDMPVRGRTGTIKIWSTLDATDEDAHEEARKRTAERRELRRPAGNHPDPGDEDTRAPGDGPVGRMVQD